MLDDPAVSDLPDTVRRVREDLLPLVASLRGGADVLDRFAGARSLLGGLRRLPADPPDTPPVIEGQAPAGPGHPAGDRESSCRPALTDPPTPRR